MKQHITPLASLALDFDREIGLHVLEHLDQAGFTELRGQGRVVVGK